MPATIQQGAKGADVKQWQGILGVTQDGDFGPATDAATRKWQSQRGITPDGVVGPATWSLALGTAVGQPSVPKPGAASLAKVRGIEKLPAGDLRALIAAANYIQIDPDWLATAISFETGGTFSPSVKNKAGSGATGLIQFMPSTARSLGTTTDALAKMSFKAQLEYVKKYFEPMKGKLHSLDDVYLYIFSPKGIGRPHDFVMYSSPEAAYTQNIGFDRDGKGYITKGDVTMSIESLLNQALALGDRLIVPAAISVGTLIVAGALIAFAIAEARKA